MGHADILIVGGGTGGCAAALAALSEGRTVIVTEETDWLGGQLTSQAVPPDENPWIEQFGSTRRYRAFRAGVRDYYRAYYPLLPAARQDPYFNPGNCWVSKLGFEPRIGAAVLDSFFMWSREIGKARFLFNHVLHAVETNGDAIKSVTLRNLHTGERITITAEFYIDATEFGDLIAKAGVEHRIGAESARKFGEPHAPSFQMGNNEQDVQAMTWCFPLAWDGKPGAFHAIEKPANYDYWKSIVPDTDPPWGGPLLGWELFASGRDMVSHRDLMPNDDDGFRGLWGYRRIRCRDHYPQESGPDEVTLVNWPQNDYFFHNPLGGKKEDRVLAFNGARDLSLALVYWLQTEAPRRDGGAGYPELYLCPEMTGTSDGLAKYPYVRESRRIQAEFTVTEKHVARDCRPEGRGSFSVLLFGTPNQAASGQTRGRFIGRVSKTTYETWC